jgi:phosphoglycerate kinase
VIALSVESGTALLLPVDVVVAKEFKAGAATRTVPVDQVAKDEMILDVGPATVEDFAKFLHNTCTVVWNGPLGAFETPPFDKGTVAAAKLVAARTKAGQLLSVAGGGDTVSALNKAGVADDFSYVSTAGGAFLEWMEGLELPGVEALMVK